MFGHQDSNKDDAKGKSDDAPTVSVAPTTIAPTAGGGSSSSSNDTASNTPIISSASNKGGKSGAGSGGSVSSSPVSPLDLSELDDLEASLSAVDNSAKPDLSGLASSSSSSKSGSAPSTSSAPSANSSSAPRASTPASAVAGSDLHELKLTVVHELSPIVDQLEQTAEEHFRTLMMMIQSAEDQSLLPQAYDAAHRIEDKKIRAQALLDVINEINYFTQQPSENA